MGIQTPFYNNHLRLGAKIVDYAGFDMPVQYSGIVSEHQAVRSAAGLFDVSHMGEFFVSGSSALSFLQNVTVNDVSLLKPGTAQYSALCYEDGGVVDDVFIYMTGSESYMMVVNAANIQKDLEWLEKHLVSGANLNNGSDTMALLALQGPASAKILNTLTDKELTDRELSGRVLSSMSRNRIEEIEVAGQSGVLVASTGYTGETGFELYIDTGQVDAPAIWDALMNAGEPHGLTAAGLGARDTLRLEMGYPLYGNDITAETTPLEAGMNWVVKPDKGDFIGRKALLEQKEKGISRKLAGFIMDEKRQIPRSGYDICDSEGVSIGAVTSGTQSVTLGKGIGMGYIPPEISSDGGKVYIRIRKKLVPATVTKPPFIRGS